MEKDKTKEEVNQNTTSKDKKEVEEETKKNEKIPKEQKKEIKKEKKLEKSLEKKEKEIENLNEKLEELNDKYLYSIAQMRDLHKNYQKDNSKSLGYLKKEIILEVLPIYDIFEKVLENKEVPKEVAAYLKGFELVLNQMKVFLESKGVSKIDSKEESLFDHNLHNAVEKVETDKKELDGKIQTTLQNGYKIDGELLRPSAVKVYAYKDKELDSDLNKEKNQTNENNQSKGEKKETEGKKETKEDKNKDLKQEEKKEVINEDKKEKGGNQND